MDITISMQRAIDLFVEKKNAVDLNNLGFILTVLRDNAVDDEVYEVLCKITEQHSFHSSK